MRARGIAGFSLVMLCVGSLSAIAGGAAPAPAAAPPATTPAPATPAPATPAPATPATPPQTFDELVATATPIARTDLAGWAWALTAACDQGDDLAQRQCRVVRDARATAERGQTYVIDGEPTAFMAGAFDPIKKSVSITVRGCIACAPVDVAGKKLFIVSNKAAPTDVGGTLQAALIHETARVFVDEDTANQWRNEVAPRLKVQLVFAVPAGNPTWSRNGKDGVAVQVLGFRVHDPCDGGIVCASPTAQKLDPDKKACGTVEEAVTQPDDDVKADRLEPWMIQQALAPALALAQQCHDTYGVDGQTKLKITINGDGSIAVLEQVGDFNDTPTGACLAKAVKTVTFPKTRKAKTSVTYPIVLR
jgi:hypothetical protein